MENSRKAPTEFMEQKIKIKRIKMNPTKNKIK